jgi:hypothetical protein
LPRKTYFLLRLGSGGLWHQNPLVKVHDDLSNFLVNTNIVLDIKYLERVLSHAK